VSACERNFKPPSPPGAITITVSRPALEHDCVAIAQRHGAALLHHLPARKWRCDVPGKPFAARVGRLIGRVLLLHLRRRQDVHAIQPQLHDREGGGEGLTCTYTAVPLAVLGQGCRLAPPDARGGAVGPLGRGRAWVRGGRVKVGGLPVVEAVAGSALC